MWTQVNNSQKKKALRLVTHILLWPWALLTAEGFSTSQVPTKTRICRWRVPLYNAKRPDSRSYNSENSEEMYWEKYSGRSNEESDMRTLEEDYVSRDAGKMNDGRYYDDYDEDYYDDNQEEEDFNDDDDISEPGNFWSNASVEGDRDRDMIRRRRTQRDRSVDSQERGYTAERRRRPPSRRSAIRNGKQSPPKPAKDFYERLFWYGFDPDDSEEVGDKTVFGGTKGKFSGLSYITAAERGPNGEAYRRRLPPSRRDEYYFDENVNGEAEDESDYYEYDAASPRLRSVKPPNDLPYPRSEPAELPERRRRKRPSRNFDSDYYDEDDYDDDNSNDWIAKSVSSWFTGEDDERGYDGDSRSRRRGRRKESSDWSPFNVVDAFFGVDRVEMREKADLYNEKMGLGSKKVSSRRRERSSSRDTPRRPGYAYRYDGDNDDLNPVVDIDSANSSSEPKTTNEISVERRIEKTEKTWEERSADVERVPPANIPAWGPSGELVNFDARTKAIMDALEDIQVARQRLEAKKKKEALAREEITILKVDAELQRRKLDETRGSRRMAQEQLRQIDFELDDASRALRRARTQTGLARDRLEKLQQRHWALLNFYNPDQAEEQVDAALNELEEVDPAARLNESVFQIPILGDDVEEVVTNNESSGVLRTENVDNGNMGANNI